MKVWLNGELRELAATASVAEVVQELGIIPETVLVECNGEALHRREWESRPLAEGDRLEFLRVVAGG